MKKRNLLAAVLALFVLNQMAAASTTVPLNTGYNHSVFSPYPTVNTIPSPPTARDNYWINIASYPTTPQPVGPSWVLRQQFGWAAPFPGTNWISAWNTPASQPGVNGSNPAYTIFRKCFCLLPGFRDARLRFRVRSDDSIQIWFNTQLNQLLPPSAPNFAVNNPVWSGGTEKGFRVGKNCVYVLLEDLGGSMGFDLEGSVTAEGLLPTPAAGVQQSFAPCSCNTGPGAVPAPAPAMDVLQGRVRREEAGEPDEQQVIRELIKTAEARRAAGQRRR